MDNIEKRFIEEIKTAQACITRARELLTHYQGLYENFDDEMAASLYAASITTDIALKLYRHSGVNAIH